MQEMRAWGGQAAAKAVAENHSHRPSLRCECTHPTRSGNPRAHLQPSRVQFPWLVSHYPDCSNSGRGSLILEQVFVTPVRGQLGRLYWGPGDAGTTAVGAERLGSSLNKEKWAFRVQEQGGEGVSGWKITKRKDQGSGRFWLN